MLMTAPNELDSDGAFFLDSTIELGVSLLALGRPFLAVPLTLPPIAMLLARGGYGNWRKCRRMEDFLGEGKIRRANGAWIRSVTDHRPQRGRGVLGDRRAAWRDCRSLIEFGIGWNGWREWCGCTRLLSFVGVAIDLGRRDEVIPRRERN
jgi:hypothetical protein